MSYKLDTGMNRKIPLLAGLVVADLLSKVAAFNLLPEDQYGDESDLFHFELAVNTSGLGTDGHQLVEVAQGPNPVLLGAIFTIGLAACLLGLNRLKKLTLIKGALSAVVILVLVCLGARLGLFPEVTPWSSVKLLRGAQSVFWLVVLSLAPSGVWGLGATLVAASALGNFLSFWYPPYAVVDFMWSSFIRRTLGMHIFNLADLMWLVGMASVVCAIISLVIKKARRIPTGETGAPGTEAK